MCRILGYFGNQNLSKDVIERATQNQIFGGPDQQSYIFGDGWGLGNNRLAIQGLDGGKQPFSLRKTYAVYNGEIYNHKELKKHLATKGYSISDDCDGSVILPMYELYGDTFVEHLDGMFIIAIVDESKEQKLLLCSDNCSMKSVYYYLDEKTDTLFFASELSALFEFPILKNIRQNAINEYLIGRSIWHNNTFFEKIYCVGPNTLLKKTKQGLLEKQTYQSKLVVNFTSMNLVDTGDFLRELLEKEVHQMLQADVPICLVTSGGLDSSLLTALASKYNNRLECFNIAYEGNWPSDERHFAKEVADYCGIKYNQVLIKESEFPSILDQTIKHLGQPNSAPHSLSTYALFKAVHEAGFKVAMTGEGADEFFGGYDRFRKATFDVDHNWLKKYFDVMCATTLEIRNSVYSNSYTNFLKKQSSILENASKKINRSAITKNSRLKALLEFDQSERFTSYILRRVDHLSMAHAVEVRIPFCQPKISSLYKALPDNYLLDKTNVKKVIYQAARSLLPESIINRPKQPFTLPITAMLNEKHILFQIMHDTLTSQSFINRGFFDHTVIQKLMSRQIKEPNNQVADILWSVMILEMWLKKSDNSFKL
ncbi:MAG: asparagine synthase (glutamine-hydrolyzing) [Pseudomonadota bacterium]